MDTKIYLPFDTEKFCKLKVGQKVLINGIIYTARDQAHKRIIDRIKKAGLKGKTKDFFDFRNQVIYYTGATPARPGRIIGSAGPTTSYRMDAFTPLLLKYGLKGMIGKGERSVAVREEIKKHRAIYFIAYGGCGALYSKCIIKKESVAYFDLGCEAIYRLNVENFPVIVGIDTKGNDLYEINRKGK
ncbi:fumarate hydratase C-terminal domain-containing protein [bacterium]|nr:fumarate hydratase C-terminal domain-containing protein [bacterium]